ncbi:MAG: hypothetical protein GX372_04675 [Ignavibacteria bacterium]|jgi:hypothetical protein|nr:hypothetical protein [Ignavibacteria bacterium]
MSKKIHIILIITLIVISIWSISIRNWFVFITNICVISGVLLEDRTQKMLMRENVNTVKVRRLQKLPTILYIIGATSLIIYGFIKFYQ